MSGLGIQQHLAAPAFVRSVVSPSSRSPFDATMRQRWHAHDKMTGLLREYGQGVVEAAREVANRLAREAGYTVGEPFQLSAMAHQLGQPLAAWINARNAANEALDTQVNACRVALLHLVQVGLEVVAHVEAWDSTVEWARFTRQPKVHASVVQRALSALGECDEAALGGAVDEAIGQLDALVVQRCDDISALYPLSGWGASVRVKVDQMAAFHECSDQLRELAWHRPFATAHGAFRAAHRRLCDAADAVRQQEHALGDVAQLALGCLSVTPSACLESMDRIADALRSPSKAPLA